MIELPVYIIVAWILINNFGIIGAAGAWTLRVAIDALLLFWAAFRVQGFSSRILETNGTILAACSLIILAGVGYALKKLMSDLPIYAQSLLMIGLIILFAWIVWDRIFDDSDRSAILNMTKLRRILESV
jgi:O-antigen/teichoic acid export membrane protein